MTKSNRFAVIRATKTSTNTNSNLASVAAHAVTETLSLSQLGWNSYFQTQLVDIDIDKVTLARVVAHHRQYYELISPCGTQQLAIHTQLPSMTVGDWLVLDAQQQFVKRLERQSLFSRKAPGSKVDQQLIAANLDWVFIVSSANQDFNLSRIERYLALVNEAGVTPVVVMTKQDLCDDIEIYIKQLRQFNAHLLIETVNALDTDSTAVLNRYAEKGKTVALIGSSGVGKSTLVNSLLGQQQQVTSGIREEDAKGRHTTTGRSLHFTYAGGLLIDTPGMRELQLADCEEGVKHTFSDIVDLATQCRFVDCQHLQAPGCAVQQALESGTLDMRRLQSYQKLLREQALNGASIAQKRAHGKSLSKLYRRVQDDARLNKRLMS
ncbi:ribosome small subunit-dependent GTPase A [Shewanella colwelliana]|uniref:ribosome small subunit-dependent GTPase A n=1 Tax=Shewanella colwelliana TaxID=23 RepID=UPI0009F1FC2A|nr:ribosome small subunit-dependent GTPase A [Shewanella colwelliana]MDX1282666.1 ribosome small subunit-dependent GTPase A [Shewanella colwelliana]